MVKFFFHLYETIIPSYGKQWDNKGAWTLYLEFIADFYKLLVYIAFFIVILMHYGIPIHIIRQLYITFASFKDRAVEVIKYRAAVRNMKSRFPDATPTELAASETCIVCRSEMKEGKKLPCGHILHFGCLRSWLERRQFCPTCMAPALVEDMQNNEQQQQQQPPLNPPQNNGREGARVEANAPQIVFLRNVLQQNLAREMNASRAHTKEGKDGDVILDEMMKMQREMQEMQGRMSALVALYQATRTETKEEKTEEKKTEEKKTEEKTEMKMEETEDEEALLQKAIALSMEEEKREEEKKEDSMEEVRRRRMLRFENEK